MQNSLARNCIIIFLMSVLVILIQHQLHFIVHGLQTLHTSVAHQLKLIFTHGWLATFLRQLINLLALPLILTLAINGIYRMLRRQNMPYVYHCLWALWIIQTILIL